MGSISPLPGSGGSGGGGFVGALRSVAVSGAHNDYNPGGGWPATYGRLDVDTSAGNANLTGLLAGADGQIIRIRNIGANVLTLNVSSALSLAANRFLYVGDMNLPQWASVLAIYYAGGVLRWTF